MRYFGGRRSASEMSSFRSRISTPRPRPRAVKRVELDCLRGETQLARGQFVDVVEKYETAIDWPATALSGSRPDVRGLWS